MKAKAMVLSFASVFFVVHFSCERFVDDLQPNDRSCIEGNYLLTKFCMAFSETAGMHPTIPLDSMLNNADCATSPIQDLISMSTLIITRDSIVRFGYHCPGDNSGSTRIAYGYRYNRGQLFGDSLSGRIEVAEGTKEMSTYLEKNQDKSITVTQIGQLYINEIDSTFIIIYRGNYDKYDSTYYKYEDEPTCRENYGPWFPIPFW
jgi:hypothetical protein